VCVCVCVCDLVPDIKVCVRVFVLNTNVK
jgi:hypothetical protein